MSDESNGPRGDGPSRRNPEPQFNWKGFILFLAAATLLASAFVAQKTQAGSKTLLYPKFKELVQKGQIYTDETHALALERQQTTMAEIIRGYYISNEAKLAAPKSAAPSTASAAPVTTIISDSDLQSFSVNVNLDYQKDELHSMMSEAGLVLTPTYNNSEMSSLIVGLLPVLLIIGLLYFMVRQQIKSAGRGAMGFGKSKAKLLNHDRNKVTFKDVAGVEEAKEEVQELVEFLRDPKKFQRLGGKIPKGVLMVGSPGTGKTLLAKAIAGEADVPFFSISGSDFVEMFVGVGASRVRDMFEQGRKNAPCIVFIDEIDAVGRHRGHGMGGGHDEREQTLNALLVEMDGFEAQEGIIIIAATNRADVLDPALLRPGRFDRQVTVSLPDVKGRDEILKVHAKKVKLSEDADIYKIARGTPGFSGAELANLINEAALLAARRNLKSIGTSELEEARDKVRWGRERRSMALSEKDKEKTAYHEAGHAILIEVLENTDPLHKVTIIPRGPSLGSTMWLPEEDKFTDRKDELLDQLVVAMGGRVAEEIKFNNVASGASGDIQMATSTARKMVCSWGMSEKLGMVRYAFDPMEMRVTYSQETATLIDEEIKRFIDEAYARARELLMKYREQLDAIALALLEYETLDGEHIKDLMKQGFMSNPPDNTPTKPSAPPPLPISNTPKPIRVDPDEDLGGLAPVPV